MGGVDQKCMSLRHYNNFKQKNEVALLAKQQRIINQVNDVEDFHHFLQFCTLQSIIDKLGHFNFWHFESPNRSQLFLITPQLREYKTKKGQINFQYFLFYCYCLRAEVNKLGIAFIGFEILSTIIYYNICMVSCSYVTLHACLHLQLAT